MDGDRGFSRSALLIRDDDSFHEREIGTILSLKKARIVPLGEKKVILAFSLSYPGWETTGRQAWEVVPRLCFWYNSGMSDLILEHLKRIQADVAETKRDVRDLKASSAMILGMIG